jgi:hypothetical protein
MDLRDYVDLDMPHTIAIPMCPKSIELTE